MIYLQPKSFLENETESFYGFRNKNGSPNLGQTTKPCDFEFKKKGETTE